MLKIISKNNKKHIILLFVIAVCIVCSVFVFVNKPTNASAGTYVLVKSGVEVTSNFSGGVQSTVVTADEQGRVSLYYEIHSDVRSVAIEFIPDVPIGTEITLIDGNAKYFNDNVYSLKTKTGGTLGSYKTSLRFPCTSRSSSEPEKPLKYYNLPTERPVKLHFVLDMPPEFNSPFTVRLLDEGDQIPNVPDIQVLPPQTKKADFTLTSQPYFYNTWSGTVYFNINVSVGNFIGLELYDNYGEPVEFPSGTTVKVGDKYASVVDNYAYASLNSIGPMQITVSGLRYGTYTFRVNVASLSRNGFMDHESTTSLTTNSITLNYNSPIYSLKVVPSSGSTDRLIDSSGSTRLYFDLQYQTTYTEYGIPLFIDVYKKTGSKYTTRIYGWETSSLFSVYGNGSSNIYITIPAGTSPGTYRIVFIMGEKQVYYNVIVK